MSLKLTIKQIIDIASSETELKRPFDIRLHGKRRVSVAARKRRGRVHVWRDEKGKVRHEFRKALAVRPL